MKPNLLLISLLSLISYQQASAASFEQRGASTEKSVPINTYGIETATKRGIESILPSGWSLFIHRSATLPSSISWNPSDTWIDVVRNLSNNFRIAVLIDWDKKLVLLRSPEVADQERLQMQELSQLAVTPLPKYDTNRVEKYAIDTRTPKEKVAPSPASPVNAIVKTDNQAISTDPKITSPAIHAIKDRVASADTAKPDDTNQFNQVSPPKKYESNIVTAIKPIAPESIANVKSLTVDELKMAQASDAIYSVTSIISQQEQTLEEKNKALIDANTRAEEAAAKALIAENEKKQIQETLKKTIQEAEERVSIAENDRNIMIQTTSELTAKINEMRINHMRDLSIKESSIKEAITPTAPEKTIENKKQSPQNEISDKKTESVQTSLTEGEILVKEEKKEEPKLLPPAKHITTMTPPIEHPASSTGVEPKTTTSKDTFSYARPVAINQSNIFRIAQGIAGKFHLKLIFLIDPQEVFPGALTLMGNDAGQDVTLCNKALGVFSNVQFSVQDGELVVFKKSLLPQELNRLKMQKRREIEEAEAQERLRLSTGLPAEYDLIPNANEKSSYSKKLQANPDVEKQKTTSKIEIIIQENQSVEITLRSFFTEKGYEFIWSPEIQGDFEATKTKIYDGNSIKEALLPLLNGLRLSCDIDNDKKIIKIRNINPVLDGFSEKNGK